MTLTARALTELVDYLSAHDVEENALEAIAAAAIDSSLSVSGPEGDLLHVEIAARYAPDRRPWVVTVSGAE